MTIELTFLMLTVYLGIFQILIAVTAATLQRGMNWNSGDRSEPVVALKGVAGRLDRALQNFKETFPLFAAAVLIVQFTAHGNNLSQIGCAMYFFARVIYVPIYAAGIRYVRSLVWVISLVGILLVALAYGA